jgi:PleD family two-component response regulator
MMPVLDGLSLLKRIKADERYSTVPVIMQTAASAPELVGAGATDASSLAADYTTLFGRTVMSRWMQSKLEKVADACPPDDAARAARCSGSTRRVSPR